jgi:hypothetical protein
VPDAIRARRRRGEGGERGRGERVRGRDRGGQERETIDGLLLGKGSRSGSLVGGDGGGGEQSAAHRSVTTSRGGERERERRRRRSWRRGTRGGEESSCLQSSSLFLELTTENRHTKLCSLPCHCCPLSLEQLLLLLEGEEGRISGRRVEE